MTAITFAATSIRPGAVTAIAIEYLRAIHQIEARDGLATPTRIAEELNVAVASTTNMCKRLAAQDLVWREPGKGVRLSEDGRRVVEEVAARRELLLDFMVNDLRCEPALATIEADRVALIASTWFCSLLATTGKHEQANEIPQH